MELRLISEQAESLRWSPTLIRLLVRELHVEDDFTRLLGNPSRVNAQRYPQAVAIALAIRHSWAVIATYLLSEEGRKASLLEGGDGKAVQQLTLHVPANRLHLVSVDANGVARLRLKPRFQLSADNRVVRIDAAPTYDAPPQIEELFREAAKNHQLERAYEDERRSAKVKRREADQERRASVARAFLSDPTQRALVHPTPTPRRCFVATDHGRILFDEATDLPPAREVPAEAHRRFRADLRARREQNLKARAEQLALHEEKKRFVAEWIATHGTPDQQARQTAGVLPMAEAIEAITDHAFDALADHRRYVPMACRGSNSSWKPVGNIRPPRSCRRTSLSRARMPKV